MLQVHLCCHDNSSMQDAVQVVHDGCQRTIIAWLLPFLDARNNIILYNIYIWWFVIITRPWVWVMTTRNSYGLWVMGYSHEIPANQLGRSKNVWVSREYGLYLVWVRRESTVKRSHSAWLREVGTRWPANTDDMQANQIWLQKRREVVKYHLQFIRLVGKQLV